MKLITTTSLAQQITTNRWYKTANATAVFPTFYSPYTLCTLCRVSSPVSNTVRLKGRRHSFEGGGDKFVSESVCCTTKCHLQNVKKRAAIILHISHQKFPGNNDTRDCSSISRPEKNSTRLWTLFSVLEVSRYQDMVCRYLNHIVCNKISHFCHLCMAPMNVTVSTLGSTVPQIHFCITRLTSDVEQ